MQQQDQTVLSNIASRLHISESTLMRESLRSFLEQQLRALNAEVLVLHLRYGVSSVEDMEARYQDGTLDEADSWRDLQRLDRLEFQRDELSKLLQTVQ
jgi:hypothetical protein